MPETLSVERDVETVSRIHPHVRLPHVSKTNLMPLARSKFRTQSAALRAHFLRGFHRARRAPRMAPADWYYHAQIKAVHGATKKRTRRASSLSSTAHRKMRGARVIIPKLV